MCPNQLLLLLLASSIFKNRQGPGLMVGCQQTGSWPYGWLSTDRGSGLMAYGWLSTDKPTAGLLGPKNADPGGAKIKFWYPLQNCHTVTPTQLQVLA